MLDELKQKIAQEKEIYIRVKAIPGAGQSKIMEKLQDNTYKIILKQRAEKGKANQELIKYLAKTFDTGKQNVKIISGAGSRIKLIKITK